MLTIVVARYQEDVAWLNQLSADVRVHVYNKGPAIPPGTLRAGIEVHVLPNHGRESGSYMHHLRHRFDASDREGHTVFTQADPFEHSPGFLYLMKIAPLWREVQPLAVQWRETSDVPPRRVIGEDVRDWVGDIPIRTEHYSLRTWAPIAFFDSGAWGIGTTYREKHRLASGTNILEHFFDLCGLDWLARAAQGCDVGAFSYGGIFAASNARIADFVERAAPHLEKMELLTRADQNYGYIFERSWLHLFGEPCIRFPARRSEALERALASESYRQAQATGAAPQPAATAVDDRVPGSELAALRRAAYDAWGRGSTAEAQAVLNRALLMDPMNGEILSDLAAIAFQQGDAERAVPYARRALLVDAQHAAARFTLGMCLARSGQDVEALQLLNALLDGPGAAAFRDESPELAALAGSERARLGTAAAVAA